MLAMLKTQAQDYFISFTGSGATTEVNTVKVDNLTSGATVTLNGGDILHLIAAVGIVSLDIADGALQIYPNPMTEQSMLTFISPESGNAVISLVDLSGKTIYQTNALLSTGRNSFRVSGMSWGMYFVKVTGKNYTCSIKLISQSNLQNQAVIEYVSSKNNTPDSPLKSVAATIDMPYTNGDQLLYKGISGIYSTVVPDVPTSSKTITFKFAACTDADNNNYSIVEIATQTWMAENLNVGVKINGVLNQTNNGIMEKYCYNDDITNCNLYGGLYMWNEMMLYVTTPGAKGICPNGWHIPTDAEWTLLGSNLGGNTVAGGKMKSTGTIEAGTGLWHTPNTGATNESGYSAFPGGYRASAGNFNALGDTDNWWSSSLNNPLNAQYRWISNAYGYLNSFGCDIYFGFSVRCVKN